MLGRLASPKELRVAAIFLLSPASNFMTGSNLDIVVGIQLGERKLHLYQY
jgi:NAD(P)-dependent dehydrogenase (short-subunit alcohol dehydrogenase family)